MYGCKRKTVTRRLVGFWARAQNTLKISTLSKLGWDPLLVKTLDLSIGIVIIEDLKKKNVCELYR